MDSFNLQVEMAKLTEPVTDKRPPYWDYWRWDLWRNACNDDPHNFTSWPCVRHTMLQDHWPDSIETEYQYLKEKIEIPYSSIGNPASSWRSLIHQTYHILRWQDATGLRIADMQSIYEFGGGYGAMVLVCNRLGFKGKYTIYDLPEFGLLQQWYLGECGVDNVEWVDSAAYGNVDLLIACYSLSETDFAERDRILQAWPANSYLFLYSNKFEQFDNIDYFRGLEYGEWNVSRWAHSHIDHLPPESWYTWGW